MTIDVVRNNPKLLPNDAYLSDRLNYIGREWHKGVYDLSASPLANPYPVNRSKNPQVYQRSLQESLKKYKRWLWEYMQTGMAGETNPVWEELIRLTLIYLTKRTLTLVCWCKPHDCHGDIIVKAIAYLIEEKTDLLQEIWDQQQNHLKAITTIY